MKNGCLLDTALETRSISILLAPKPLHTAILRYHKSPFLVYAHKYHKKILRSVVETFGLMSSATHLCRSLYSGSFSSVGAQWIPGTGVPVLASIVYVEFVPVTSAPNSTGRSHYCGSELVSTPARGRTWGDFSHYSRMLHIIPVAAKQLVHKPCRTKLRRTKHLLCTDLLPHEYIFSPHDSRTSVCKSVNGRGISKSLVSW